MSATPSNELPEYGDLQANAVLDLLLERLEMVLGEAMTDWCGQPFFAVEAKLQAQLQESLPGVRFGAQDIRAWASEISS